jgi:L-asparaginase
MVRRKVAKILGRAYEKLSRSSALEAVVEAVKLLEDAGSFNAGRGAVAQSDGVRRLSASLMDSESGRFAAVINLESLRNPLLVCRALLQEEFRVMAGKGAQDFARQAGFPLVKQKRHTARSLKDRRERSRAFPTTVVNKLNEVGTMDTVGACALDQFGRLAAATSTGGRLGSPAGRVSDSAMPVANFADVGVAVSATGIGEESIDQGLGLRIATRVADGFSLKQAFGRTFREVGAKGYRMGAIGVDAKGRACWGTTTEVLIYGFRKGRHISIF